ncbi:MAG: hypothetical protein ACRDNJ_11075 [Solirubrobacteraceae bacterium]
MTERINASAGGNRCVWRSQIAALAKRMVVGGQLECAPETFTVNHTRYRYHRRRELDGPIAGLERRLQQGEAV